MLICTCKKGGVKKLKIKIFLIKNLALYKKSDYVYGNAKFYPFGGLFMFTSVAYAAAGAPAGQGGQASMLVQFLPLILMFVVFYFLLIRPQQKKAKEHRAMLDNIKKGDHVLTSAGILGRVIDIEGQLLVLDLGKTEVKVVRGYISSVVDPKNLSATAPSPEEAKNNEPKA